MNSNTQCRCHLFDNNLPDLDKEINEYIKSLDESIKVEKERYEERLLLCGECNQIMSGTCKLCGCFVKARAAKKNLSCPAIPPKWEGMS
jgi:hypothetical protein